MTLGLTICVEGAHRVPGHAVNGAIICVAFLPYLSYCIAHRFIRFDTNVKEVKWIFILSMPNQFRHLDGIIVWKYFVMRKLLSNVSSY